MEYKYEEIKTLLDPGGGGGGQRGMPPSPGKKNPGAAPGREAPHLPEAELSVTERIGCQVLAVGGEGESCYCSLVASQDLARRERERIKRLISYLQNS